jgi:hypothetical protein
MRWLALTTIGLFATACGARTELDLVPSDAGSTSARGISGGGTSGGGNGGGTSGGTSGGRTSGGSTSSGKASGCPTGSGGVSPIVREGDSCSTWGANTACAVRVDACGNGALVNEVCGCVNGSIRCPRPPAGTCGPPTCPSVVDDPLSGCPSACPTGTTCVLRSQSGGVGLVGCFPIPGACAADQTCECLQCLCGGRKCTNASVQPPYIFCE